MYPVLEGVLYYLLLCNNLRKLFRLAVFIIMLLGTRTLASSGRFAGLRLFSPGATLSRVASPFSTLDGKEKSLWHDVPLVKEARNKDNPTYNFVCEIPAFTKAKMEISTNSPFNPIIQDKNKDGSPRFYHGPIYWNYGCLPQTWEDPRVLNEQCENTYGDNDPLDVVEIGSTVLPMGSIAPVKILGALGLIDCGELDWKLIAVHAEDPLVTDHKIENLDDLHRVCPHHVNGIREWFRWYKRPDNKPLNEYAFSGKAIDRKDAIEVIKETHQHWKELMKAEGKVSDSNPLWVKK